MGRVTSNPPLGEEDSLGLIRDKARVSRQPCYILQKWLKALQIELAIHQSLALADKD